MKRVNVSWWKGEYFPKTKINEGIIKKYKILENFPGAKAVEIIKGNSFPDDGSVFNIQLYGGNRPFNLYKINGKHIMKFTNGDSRLIHGDYIVDSNVAIMRIFMRRVKGRVSQPNFAPVNGPVNLPKYIKLDYEITVRDEIPGEQYKKILAIISNVNSYQKLVEIYLSRPVTFYVLSSIEIQDPHCLFLHNLHEVDVNDELVNAFYFLYKLSNIPNKNNAYRLMVDEKIYRPHNLIRQVENFLKKKNKNLSFNDYVEYDPAKKYEINECSTINSLFTGLKLNAFSYCYPSMPIEYPNIGLKIYHYYSSYIDNFARQILNYPGDFNMKVYRRSTSTYPLSGTKEVIVDDESRFISDVSSSEIKCFDIGDKRELLVSSDRMYELGREFGDEIKKLVNFIDKVITPIKLEDYSIQLTSSLMQGGLKHHMDGFKKKGSVLVVFNLNTRIYYDMLPVFAKGEPTRVKLNSGDVVIMTNESRYSWSHSYSSNTPTAKKRYNIVFRGSPK